MTAPDSKTTQTGSRTLLRRLRYNLDFLLLDNRLQEAGYKLFFVLDFAALFAYLHKSFDTAFVFALPGEPEERQFVRLQNALEILFTGRYNLLLIPPYALELKNHLAIIGRDTQWSADLLSRRNEYKQKIQRFVGKYSLFKDFLKLVTDKNDGADKPTYNTIQAVALDIGRRYFAELFLIATLDKTLSAFKLLSQMFTDHILQNAETVLPNVSHNYTNPSHVTDWYRSISKHRNTQRAYHSYIDALACSYVVEANSSLFSERTVVLFATPSNHVHAAASQLRLSVTRDSMEVPLVRGLDYFLAALMQQQQDPGAGAAWIEQTRSLILDLESAEDYVTVDRSNGDTAAAEDKVFNHSKDRWTEIESRLLAYDLSRMEDRAPKPERTSQPDAFLNLLDRLLQAVSSGEWNILDEIQTLLGQMQREVGKLSNFIPVGLDTLRSTIVRQTEDVIEIDVVGLPAETEMYIRLSHSQTIALAEQLRDAITASDGDALLSIRRTIMNLPTDPASPIENCLVRGYLLAVEARWQAAEAILLQAAQRSGPGQEECLYLLGMIHRKLFESGPALGYIKQAVAIRPNDPRFELEYGNTLWLMWHQRASSEFAGNLLEDAISWTEKASRNSSAGINIALDAQISNLLAFLYTEKTVNHTSEAETYLDMAGVQINHLEKLLPEHKWIGRFFDTRGYFNQVSASMAANSEIRRRCLERALRDYLMALKDTSLLPPKRLLIESHLERATRDLNALEAR